MLIRILICLLSIYACESHKLAGDIDEEKDSADQEPECLATCDEACQDWGDWSVASPATDSVCVGQKLTQSQNRTRTCKATCAGVSCSKTENKETEVDGTKSCPEPPPPCKTTCGDGCQDWTIGNWLPAVTTECKDVNFTQNRTNERECYDTCDDRADCLCSGIQCQTTKSESQAAIGTKVINCQTACNSYTYDQWSPQVSASEMCVGQSKEQTRTGRRNCPRDDCSTCETTITGKRTLQGTKVTPCQAENSTYCNSWQEVSGNEGVWSPARNTVNLGVSFEQSRKEKRTCPRACPNSSCKLTRTKTQNVTGTKTCKTEHVNRGEDMDAWFALNNECKDADASKPLWDATITDRASSTANCCVEAPKIDPVKPEKTCAEGCGEWNLKDWQWTSVGEQCPEATSLTKPTLVAEEEIRTRTRECRDLKAGLQCFTVNIERRTTECQWCNCQDDCDDYLWSEWSITADEVCAGQTVTQTRTGTRNCPSDNCSACEKTKTDSQTITGTKVCVEPPPPCKTTCDTGCKDWKPDYGDEEGWSPAESTICKGNNFEQTRTQTRECDGTCDDKANCLCSGIRCETTKSDSQEATGTKVTPCQAEDSSYCDDWQVVAGDEGLWSPARDTVSLGESFEQSRKEERTCPRATCPDSPCKLTRTQKQNVTGTKTCQVEYNNRGGNILAQIALNNECQKEYQLSKPIWDMTIDDQASSVANCCMEAPTPPPEETCADGCSEWNDWQWISTGEQCPDPIAISEPTSIVEATRTKTRECHNLKEGLECFTTNIETQTAECKTAQACTEYRGCPSNKKLIEAHATTARGSRPLDNCCEFKTCLEAYNSLDQQGRDQWCNATYGYKWKDLDDAENADLLASKRENSTISNCCEEIRCNEVPKNNATRKECDKDGAWEWVIVTDSNVTHGFTGKDLANRCCKLKSCADREERERKFCENPRPNAVAPRSGTQSLRNDFSYDCGDAADKCGFNSTWNNGANAGNCCDCSGVGRTKWNHLYTRCGCPTDVTVTAVTETNCRKSGGTWKESHCWCDCGSNNKIFDAEIGYCKPKHCAPFDVNDKDLADSCESNSNKGVVHKAPLNCCQCYGTDTISDDRCRSESTGLLYPVVNP